MHVCVFSGHDEVTAAIFGHGSVGSQRRPSSSPSSPSSPWPPQSCWKVVGLNSGRWKDRRRRKRERGEKRQNTLLIVDSRCKCSISACPTQVPKSFLPPRSHSRLDRRLRLSEGPLRPLPFPTHREEPHLLPSRHLQPLVLALPRIRQHRREPVRRQQK